MAKGKILVVGGAGYIGSHAVKALDSRGYDLVVLDDLSTGHRDAVQAGTFVEGDLGDRPTLDRLFATHRIEAVMHFAAFAYVGESVQQPGKYYRNNVAATLTLLEAMRDHGIRHFIFSSTCATYGIPQEVPIPETHSQWPINPYGWTKLMVERMLADFDRAHGLRYVAFRYFNAAGADPDGRLGERHEPETHLIPLVLRAADGGEPLKVFGDDYPTPDGTCIRDYIHVSDLADAHVLGLERLLAGGESTVYNLGNGQGFSVKEVIAMAERVTGRPVPHTFAPRREGDPPALVGSAGRAREELGWQPRFADLESMIATAHNFHQGRVPMGGHHG